jgi:hypothetical protein
VGAGYGHPYDDGEGRSPGRVHGRVHGHGHGRSPPAGDPAESPSLVSFSMTDGSTISKLAVDDNGRAYFHDASPIHGGAGGAGGAGGVGGVGGAGGVGGVGGGGGGVGAGLFRVDGRGKKHQCPQCPKRFNRPSSLRIHVNTHTGARRTSPPPSRFTSVFGTQLIPLSLPSLLIYSIFNLFWIFFGLFGFCVHALQLSTARTQTAAASSTSTPTCADTTATTAWPRRLRCTPHDTTAGADRAGTRVPTPVGRRARCSMSRHMGSRRGR